MDCTGSGKGVWEKWSSPSATTQATNSLISTQKGMDTGGKMAVSGVGANPDNYQRISMH